MALLYGRAGGALNSKKRRFPAQAVESLPEQPVPLRPELLPACLDEGLLSLCLPILVCMENPYMENK